MQFSTVFTFLTIAMTAAAAPAEVVARTTITPETCSIPDSKPYCCKSVSGKTPSLLDVAAGLGVDVSALLSCTVGAVGGQCNNQVKCCKGNGTNNGNALIFVNANCIF